MTNILEVKNLTFYYERQLVLDQIDFHLQQGEFLAVIGPNGSGKTTLMKAILGLIEPHEGVITVFGQNIQTLRDRYRIGYVSQKSNSFNTDFPATVEEVVFSGLTGKRGLFRRFTSEDRNKVKEILDLLEIADLAKKNIGKLSGGQQQRVFIARALVAEPELLILDEPTVGIDVNSVEKLYKLLKMFHREKKISMILVTHELNAVTNLVDRVVCLNKRLIFHGSAQAYRVTQKEILSQMYGTNIQLVHHDH